MNINFKIIAIINNEKNLKNVLEFILKYPSIKICIMLRDVNHNQFDLEKLIEIYFQTIKAIIFNRLQPIPHSRFRPIPLDPTLHSSPEVNHHDSYDQQKVGRQSRQRSEKYGSHDPQRQSRLPHEPPSPWHLCRRRHRSDVERIQGVLGRVPPDLPRRTQPPIPHPCLLYTSPSPRDRTRSRMPSSA